MEIQMVDLHTHTFFSDGVLIPSELVRRAQQKGWHCIGITDHVDMSNYGVAVERICGFCKAIEKDAGMSVIPGVELTYVPPGLIADIVGRVRDAGAKLVLVHGETIVEPVIPGTNRAAIEAHVDVLAHPGLITAEEVKLALQNSVCLEVSGRKGHSLTNGHVVKLAKEVGAKLTFGSDTHEPDNLLAVKQAKKVCYGAGLGKDETDELFRNALEICKGCFQ